MLGDISNDKAALQSEGKWKYSLHFRQSKSEKKQNAPATRAGKPNSNRIGSINGFELSLDPSYAEIKDQQQDNCRSI